MLSIGTFRIFYAKVVHNQGEGYIPHVMMSHTIGDGNGAISMWGEVLSEQVVGNATSLRQFIHAFSNLCYAGTEVLESWFRMTFDIISGSSKVGSLGL